MSNTYYAHLKIGILVIIIQISNWYWL